MLATQHPVEYQLFTLMIAGCLGAVLTATAQQPERLLPHTLVGKDQQSTSEGGFLLDMCHFCTIIKLENFKLNHRKLDTVYMY